MTHKSILKSSIIYRTPRAVLAAGAATGALLASGTAWAQAPASAAAPAAASSETAAPALQEVVVTGSRVITNGNASPTPQTIVQADQLVALKPGPVAEALSILPVFVASRTAVGQTGNGVANAQASQLNLRNLGYQRTLVLVDGHRLSPTTYDQIVDVSAIPQMLLQRVDVVTGGASAVYGSDAVAGVVNFVTDTKFNGLKLDLEGGQSTYGDEQTISVGAAAGRSFLDGKAHAELSYEYYNDPGISRRSLRPATAALWTSVGTGAASNPYSLVRDSRTTAYTFGGLISGATGTGAALNGQTFGLNGVLTPFVHGAATSLPAFESGGSGAYDDNSLKYSLNTNKFFGRLSYDFSDTLHAYVEASDSITHNTNYGQYVHLTNVTMNGQNPFLAPAYQFNGTFKLSEYMQDAPRVDTNATVNQYFVVTGLQGQIHDYNWELSYSHGGSRQNARDDNNINTQRLAAALDATTNSAGQVVCRASLTNAAYSNCVPLNVFGSTTASAAALAYITQATQFTANNAMDEVTGSISGKPFSTWAGPVSVALSGEWRNQSLQIASNNQPSDLADCTSLTTNCAGLKAWQYTVQATRSPVSESVGEGALETEVPLVRDLPFAQDISFNGAVRYTDYSITGSNWTWKAGLVWKVNDEWKLRATRSHDIRAPTLWDLYSIPSITNAQNTDILTKTVNATAPSYMAAGNLKLKAEEGNTTTVGFVYQPKWLPRFSISADAYNIDVPNAITNVQGANSSIQQICYASGGASSLCQLIQRPSYTDTSASNVVTAWYASSINASVVKTYGADFEANYSATVFDNPLKLRGLVTWQPHFTTLNPGQPLLETAGLAYSNVSGQTALPVLRVNLFANYSIKNFEIGMLERWRSGLSEVRTAAPNNNYVQASVPDVAYTDLNLTYHVKDWALGKADIFLNVQNLLNTQPPVAAAGGAGNPGQAGGFVFGDDPTGRYFRVGIRFRH